MKTNRTLALCALIPSAALSVSLSAAADPLQIVTPGQPHGPGRYERVVQHVAGMVGDGSLRQKAGEYGLDLVNVMWEDTGRYLGSSVGPNISDVTIEVAVEGPQGNRNYLMPVIRYPNFTDKTADIKLDSFYLRVGNHRRDGELTTISLAEFLTHPTRYMSLPQRGKIKGGDLLAKRDSHVLVSAQSAFLPIPQGKAAKFYPVIFNYQSYRENPAVLTILATRQGTSMTIIDNTRDTVSGGASWGQRLYFNHGGERAPLSAERLGDVVQSGVTQNGDSAQSLGKDSNLLMLIQVPLQVKTRRSIEMAVGDMSMAEGAPMAAGAGAPEPRRSRRADMDVAVLGHGPSEGPYTELDGLTIARDPRFPIRVTVQYYQATSTGVINGEHMAMVAGQIGKTYERGDYVGSLVVPDIGVARPTAYTGTSAAPAYLTWNDFPGVVERVNKYGRTLRHMWW